MQLQPALQLALLIQWIVCNFVQSQSEIIASPSQGNYIIYEESTNDLTYAWGSWDEEGFRVNSSIPVTIQRIENDGQMPLVLGNRGERPLSPSQAVFLVTSDCSTSETDVVPSVTFGDDSGSGIHSVLVELNVDSDGSQSMQFLQSSFYSATWSYIFSCPPFFYSTSTTPATELPPSEGLVPVDERTACLTEGECDQRRQERGFAKFRVGNYPNLYGCFYKNDIAYFGLGGTPEQMTEDLLGEKERIWCRIEETEQPTKEPTPSVSLEEETACLTEDECDLQRQQDGFAKFRVGNYPKYGCFSKGGIAYFGLGGTDSQMEEALTGKKQRIWCSTVSKKSTETSCYTEEECDERRKELGFKKFSVGEYPVFGCFSKNDRAYFGKGGSRKEMGKSSLSGTKERIWCDGSGGVNKLSSAAQQSRTENAPSSASSGQRPLIFNVLVIALACVFLVSVVSSGFDNGAINAFGACSSGHLFRFGVVAVAAIAVSSTTSTKSLSSSGNKGKGQFSTKSRSLQTCKFNLEILIDGCERAFNISAPAARLIDVVVENFSVSSNDIDPHTTEYSYSADLTFPDSDARDLDTSLDNTTYVEMLFEESCGEVVCGRPFVDAKGKSVQALPFVNPGSSWSVDEPLRHQSKECLVSNAGDVEGNTTSYDGNVLGREWTKKALGEHASVASFAAFSIALMTNHAPSTLVEDALIAGLDEIRHARTSFQIASALTGKEIGPGPLPESTHSFNHDLTALALAVAKEGCVDETLSAFVASAEADEIGEVLKEGTGNSKYTGVDGPILAWIRDELRVIAKEEGTHSALAWKTLEWICGVDSDACDAAQQKVFSEKALQTALRRHLDNSLLENNESMNKMGSYWEGIYLSQKFIQDRLNLSEPVCSG